MPPKKPTSATSKPFPKALEELLREHEISQRELARRTKRHGWGHTSTINFLAQGELSPSIRAMEAIAKALQIRPEHFAEYRLAKRRAELSPDVVGLKAALKALGE